jgi:hypothetical protein
MRRFVFWMHGIVFLAVLSFAFLACSTTGGAQKAKAAESAGIVDTLKDFSLTYAHSADLDFDVKNPGTWPNNDSSRLWPTADSPQYLVYKLKDIAGFTFVVGYYVYQHPNNSKLRTFNVFVSPDGQAWSEVAVTSGEANNGCWIFTKWKQDGEIPAGMSFIKFEFSDKDLHWSTEISEVHVTGR